MKNIANKKRLEKIKEKNEKLQQKLGELRKIKYDQEMEFEMNKGDIAQKNNSINETLKFHTAWQRLIQRNRQKSRMWQRSFWIDHERFQNNFFAIQMQAKSQVNQQLNSNRRSILIQSNKRFQLINENHVFEKLNLTDYNYHDIQCILDRLQTLKQPRSIIDVGQLM